MNDEIELISDGDGLVVIGESAAVERFVASTGLPSKDLGLQRLRPVVSKAAAAVQSGTEIAAQSGRWMKLTEESAKAASKLPLVKGSGGFHAITRGQNGQFAKNLQFVAKPGAFLANPALLAGAAGLMAQLAMQQAMEEITEYLAVIDAKVDDVLRAQKDAVFADMLGIEMMLDEAMVVRAQVGRVSEVTWSKGQATATTIARTQAYALLQLDALAEKLERKSKMGELAEITEQAESTVQEWIAVLARCFQLQEGMAVLELDRVFDSSPEELDQHRIALQTARQNRLNLIAKSTQLLVERMQTAAGTANAKVLLHPSASRAVVNSSNHVTSGIGEFHVVVGIEHKRSSLEATRWVDAAAGVRDDVFEAGADGVGAVGRFGNEALANTRSATGKLAGKIAEKLLRQNGAKPREED